MYYESLVLASLYSIPPQHCMQSIPKPTSPQIFNFFADFLHTAFFQDSGVPNGRVCMCVYTFMCPKYRCLCYISPQMPLKCDQLICCYYRLNVNFDLVVRDLILLYSSPSFHENGI